MKSDGRYRLVHSVCCVPNKWFPCSLKFESFFFFKIVGWRSKKITSCHRIIWNLASVYINRVLLGHSHTQVYCLSHIGTGSVTGITWLRNLKAFITWISIENVWHLALGLLSERKEDRLKYVRCSGTKLWNQDEAEKDYLSSALMKQLREQCTNSSWHGLT